MSQVLVRKSPSVSSIRKNKTRDGEGLAGWLFVSPAVILFFVFILAPFIAALALSFFQWDLLTPAEFAGLSNFKFFLTDAAAHQALSNTFIFAFASVVTHIGIGMLLALAVNRKMSKIVQYIVRSSVFFPFLISWAAVSLLWKYVLDPNFGIINYYLNKVGIQAPLWLIDENWALPAIIGIDWWHTIGYTFVILLAGLQTVPQTLYEAAKVDGANVWRRFWNVTVPGMAPTLVFATIITFIGAFQIFEPMRIITQGGPAGSTRSIVLYLYEQAFEQFQIGYASTIAMVVFLVIMAVTLLELRLTRKWIEA